MDFDISKLIEAGFDIQTGLVYTGSEEKYISALQRFVKSSSGNKEKINAYLDSDDLENFMITVHALKSNSKMIGAMVLSSMFETLEMASKNNDRAAVDANFQRTLDEYGKVLEVLRPLEEMDSFKASGEIGAKEALETADALLEALDDFDDDLAASLVKKLAGYPFRITQREKLESAAENISQFMYDEAAALIREIYPTID